MREQVVARGSSLVKKESMVPFSLLLFYLILEYGRPQELLPFLRVLRLSAIASIVLTLFIVSSTKIQLKDKNTTLFLLLLGLMVMHGPIAVNNYWALMWFITMTSNFIVFLAMIRYVDTPDKYNRLVKYWISIHIFLAIIGIVKHGRGIGGFFSDENDFCMTMNMIIPFSFFLAMNASGKNKIFYILLAGLFLFAIILSNSRGGFVGLVAAFIYCWLRTKRKILTASILGVLTVFTVVVAPPSYWDRVRSITEEGADKGTGEERIYTWKIGWHMFLDNPIIGVGQGNFPYEFKKYELKATGSNESFHGRSVAGRAAHSIYITMLSELGIIGTGIFIGMIINILKDLKGIKVRTFLQKNKVSSPISNNNYFLALALEGALVSYLVSGAFISILYYPNLWILMGFVISLKKITVRDSQPATT
jgi:O-antigen ligase